MMSKTLFLATIFCFVSIAIPIEGHAQSVAGGQNQVFNWDSREVVSPSLIAADTISGSAIGDVLTILLRDAKVDLQSSSAGLVGTWVGTIRVPLATSRNGKPLHIKENLWGFIGKDEGSRVTIVFDAGGKVKVIELPFGKKFQGNLFRAFSGKLPRLDNYSLALLIVVEWRSTANFAQASIDSIDVTASSGAKPSKSKKVKGKN